MSGRACRACSSGPLQGDTAANRAALPRNLVHTGRGLCGQCYDALYHAGRLDDFPRTTRSSVELVADAQILRARNPEFWTWAKVAAELGVSWAALDMARRRVRGAA